MVCQMAMAVRRSDSRPDAGATVAGSGNDGVAVNRTGPLPSTTSTPSGAAGPGTMASNEGPPSTCPVILNGMVTETICVLTFALGAAETAVGIPAVPGSG